MTTAFNISIETHNLDVVSELFIREEIDKSALTVCFF